MEKLSSGLRINGAKDDAAGLAISEKMRGQIRGLDQASANAQDANSMIQTAEGALSETTDILQRMRELATQAGNDTNTDTDRGEIQKEINQLTSEINRIGNTTEFNTQKLLDGGSAGKTTVVVENTTEAVDGSNDALAATKTIAGLEFTAKTAGTDGNDISFTVDTAVDPADGSEIQNSITVTGSDIVVTIGRNADGTAKTLDQDAVKALIDGDDDANALVSVEVSNGATAVTDTTIENLENGANATTPGTPGEFSFTATVPKEGQIYNIDGEELTLTLAEDADANAVAVALKTAIEGNATLNAKYEVADPTTGTTLSLTQKVASESAAAPVVELELATASEGFSANFQIGANAGQSMTIEIGDMRATSDSLKVASEDGTTVTSKSGKVASYTTATDVTNGSNNEGTFKALDISSHEKASAAIDVINDAIENVSAERSKLGAYQNRLDHTINNLSTSSENLTAAESRIRDVDMAKEMMDQTKNSILSQASQAMLAQANQLPQGVLQLLR
ncbi:FlaB [Bacillus sp. B1-b2]|nr:FlaB [Bacillus sp. B1-b2]